MKATCRPYLSALILILLFYSNAVALLIPSTNVAQVLHKEDPAYPDEDGVIFSALEKEMHLKGIMERLRVIEDEDAAIESGENVIRIKITRNRWHTRKPLFIPYILNRYIKEYIIESFVEIPKGKNDVSIIRITAVTAAPVVAQYIDNDKYDPVLFPNQTEQLEINEETGKMLAKKPTNHLFNRLR